MNMMSKRYVNDFLTISLRTAGRRRETKARDVVPGVSTAEYVRSKAPHWQRSAYRQILGPFSGILCSYGFSDLLVDDDRELLEALSETGLIRFKGAMSAHILLVDDDPALLEALSEAVRLRMGAVVDTCHGGSDALERVSVIDYDAIVSDVKMPHMDGLTLMTKIHAIRPMTPTILITGHGDRELSRKALHSGAYAFIEKPIDRDGFIASLQQAVQIRHRSL
jgi:CheY-like chemotaxis protein